jgi:hypothetical protein
MIFLSDGIAMSLFAVADGVPMPWTLLFSGVM